DEGHSSVDHILALRAELAAANKRALKFERIAVAYIQTYGPLTFYIGEGNG
ncbi:hypothetical protein UFOVP472_1, partial [uncultured Caudovirales phage]